MPHKLLLADDSVTIQRVIELTFADEDVQVVAVSDGAQAIARLQSEAPDIVLADVGMPERDGYDVAAFVKTTPGLSHIPVLLLTGAFEPVDEGRARSCRCDGVLVKPFEPHMLISRVKGLLTGKRSGQAGAPTPPQDDASRAPEPPADTMRSATVAPRGTQPLPPERPAVDPASIEDYFDRLDAAFASLDSSSDTARPPVPAPELRDQPGAGNLALADELASWDPDVAGDAPALNASSQFAPEPAAADTLGSGTPVSAHPSTGIAPAVASSVATAATPLPSLADAFAALLAAESGHSTAAPAPRVPVTEELVEQLTHRVAERMTESTVRNLVGEIAERLVREEIARLKSS